MQNSMWKKGLVFGIIVLFIGTCLIPGIQMTNVRAKDIYAVESDWSSKFNVLINSFFTADANGPYKGYKDVNISFNGSAFGGKTPYSWYWTFGDGNTSMQQNPKHAYVSTGVFNVSLKVTDADNVSATDITFAKVRNKLVADAGGPYYGYAKTDIWFNGSAVGGEPPYYFSWDLNADGEYNDAYGNMVHNSYDIPGVYNISIMVRDNSYPWHYSINTTQVTVKMNNTPPNIPNKPSGQTNGKIVQEYTYTTSTTDPNGDQVNYLWDWGNGNNSGWLGPYNSGLTISTTHKWTVKGSYSIKVKVKDTHGVESPWSDPLPITMPYTFNRLLLQFLELLFQRFPNVFPLLRHVLDH
jgi:PKD repeat protein